MLIVPNLVTEMMAHIAIRLNPLMEEVLALLQSAQDVRSMVASGTQSVRMDIMLQDAACAQRIVLQTSQTSVSHARSQLTIEDKESHSHASLSMNTKQASAILTVCMSVMEMVPSVGDIAQKVPQFVEEPCVSRQT